MSDIKLVSEEYTSRFVTGPELQTELSKKQDDVGFYVDGYNVNLDNKGISQGGAAYENFFEGPTEFANGVVIQSKKPVLDVTSSDDSVIVTRSADGYGVDLKANGGGSKWVTDESDGGRTWVSLGKDKYGAMVNSVFVTGPLYDKDGKEITGGGGGGGGADKSDKWFCVAFYTGSDMTGFNEFRQADDVIKEVWAWWGYGSGGGSGASNESNCAVVTFQKPMSMAEINSYFATEKLVMGGMGNIVESDIFPMMAICPYDGNLPSDAHSTFNPGPVL